MGAAGNFDKHYRELLSAFSTIAEPDEALHVRLSAAARYLARAEECAEIVAQEGLLIPGSQGQRVLNPAATEERLCRREADRIWSETLPIDSVDEDDTEDESELSITSLRARQAANARWSRAKASGER